MTNKCGIILAGGEGKRMKSDKPKTLSEVLGKPMLLWIIEALDKADVKSICIVTGYKKEYIEDYIKDLPYEIETVFQSERRGTAHAVMMARDFLLKNSPGDVIILNGDAPFMDSETIKNAFEPHNDAKNSATVISAVVDDPTGYGRIVRGNDGNLLKIVEQKDANDEEQRICEINSGAYWFDTESLVSVLGDIKAENKAGEYYLPDAVKLLLNNGKCADAFVADSSDTVLGANDAKQLEELNEIAKKKYGVQ